MAKIRKGYSCYKLDQESRNKLLAAFPAWFDTVRCDHVTVEFGCTSEDPLPPVADVEVVGYACTDGLECFVVEVNGTVLRKDGKINHITLSFDKEEFSAKHSNDILEKYGWCDIDQRINITTYPKFI